MLVDKLCVMKLCKVWLLRKLLDCSPQICSGKKASHKAVTISLVVFVLMVSPYLYPLPLISESKAYIQTMFADFSARTQLYIGVTGLSLEITNPSPLVDYVVSQDLNDYKKYVIAHKDLFEAYKHDSKKASITQWGRWHYQDHGNSEEHSMAYLSWRSERKYLPEFAPASPVKFEIFDRSARVRLDFDTPRSYVSVGNLCFTMMTISISCWYPVGSTDVNNVVFETSD